MFCAADPTVKFQHGYSQFEGEAALRELEPREADYQPSAALSRRFVADTDAGPAADMTIVQWVFC